MRELSTYGGCGDVAEARREAVRSRALGAVVRVCALPATPEEGQSVTRTRPTRGSTELKTLVSASAMRRDTTAVEASR